MDFAWDTTQQCYINAEDLWGIEPHVVQQRSYCCPFCAIPLTPCSYQRDNLKRPYFSARQRVHAPECTPTSAAAGAANASTSPTHRSGPPEPYINKVRFPSLEHHERGGTQVSPLSNREITADGTNGAHGPLPRHAHTAQAIRAVVRWYLHNPDKATAALDIPGVHGRTYGTIFCAIRYQEGYRFAGQHLFYGSFQYTTPPTEPAPAQPYWDITFIQGQSRAKVAQPQKFRVHVHVDRWPPGQQDWFAHELNIALEETKAAHHHTTSRAQRRGTHQPTTKTRQVEPWMFFVGEPDQTDPFLFHVRHYHAIFVAAWKYEPLPGNSTALVSMTAIPTSNPPATAPNSTAAPSVPTSRTPIRPSPPPVVAVITEQRIAAVRSTSVVPPSPQPEQAHPSADTLVRRLWRWLFKR